MPFPNSFGAPDVALQTTGQPILIYNAIQDVTNCGDGFSHVWTSRYVNETTLRAPVRVDAEVLVANHGFGSIAKIGSTLIALYMNPSTSRFALRASNNDGVSWGSPFLPAAIADVAVTHDISPGCGQLYTSGSTMYLFFIEPLWTGVGTLRYITSSDGLSWSGVITDTGQTTSGWGAWGTGRFGRPFRVSRAASGTWLLGAEFFGGSAGRSGIQVSRSANLAAWSSYNTVDFNTSGSPTAEHMGSIFDHPSSPGALICAYYGAKSTNAADTGNDGVDNICHKFSSDDGATWDTIGQENGFVDSDKTVIQVIQPVIAYVPAWNKIIAWGSGSAPQFPNRESGGPVGYLEATFLTKCQVLAGLNVGVEALNPITNGSSSSCVTSTCDCPEYIDESPLPPRITPKLRIGTPITSAPAAGSAQKAKA